MIAGLQIASLKIANPADALGLADAAAQALPLWLLAVALLNGAGLCAFAIFWFVERYPARGALAFVLAAPLLVLALMGVLALAVMGVR